MVSAAFTVIFSLLAIIGLCLITDDVLAKYLYENDGIIEENFVEDFVEIINDHKGGKYH